MTRILVLSYYVEDLVQLILQRAGYECLMTCGGFSPNFDESIEYEEKALKILRTQPIDLFIHDLNRFGKRGYLWGGVEFLQQRKYDPFLSQIPVLTVSAMSQEGIARLLQGVGLDINDLGDFLPVPLGPIELLDTVASILKRYNKPVPPEAERAKVAFKLKRAQACKSPSKIYGFLNISKRWRAS